MEYTPNQFSELEDFKTGTLLLMNKPEGYTSFDVVNKLRWLIRKKMGIKKIKVGHAGTLDPLATGLLVICTGRMTKQIQFLTADTKIYEAEIIVGKTTPSFDLESLPEGDFSYSHVDEKLVFSVAKSFLGKQEQTPPQFSAKKIDGVRAYVSAREGVAVKMKKNEIEIFDLTINKIDLPKISFTVHTSKGTYIRSLANDFGKRLDSGAYLSKLVRTKSGVFDLKDALTIQQFEDRLNELPELEG